MRRDGKTTGVRRRSIARSGGPAGGDQRTTLSFLLATFAVAVSAFLGLGQAAASAITADPIPIADGTFPTNRSRLDPTPPSTRIQSVSEVASDDLKATLERLKHLPDPTDGSASVTAPSTTTSQVEAVQIETVQIESTTSVVDPAPSTVASPTTPTTPTTPATPMTPTTPTQPTTPTPSTQPTITTVLPPDTMAIRERRPVSQAAFQNFVAACDFTTVEYLTPALVHGTIVQSNQRINVVLVRRSATAPMRVSPDHRGREPVGEWARAIGATVGINANWYRPFDGPAVSEGRVYGGPDHGYTALFGFTAEGDLVADHHHKIHDRVDSRVVEAVSGHPTLIHRGTPTADFGEDPTFSERHPRTAIGVSISVDVLILVTVDGRRSDSVGMTGAETTGLLQRLGAHDAVMLDGGGSSAMWISGKGIVNRQSDPGRAVGNQIAVFGR